jgi:acyl-coenzyme A thioesterase PaaI-like protein
MDAVPENQDLSFPFGDGGCFGCSDSNAAGLHLKFRRVGDEIRASYRIPEQFHGAPGVAHGGIVATIVDEYSCAAAVFLRGTRVVTGELTVRYHTPCPVETDLVVAARILEDTHPRYYVIQADVLAGDELLARSSGRFFRAPAASAQEEAAG